MAAGVMLDASRPSLIETAGIEVDRTLMAFDYLNGLPVDPPSPTRCRRSAHRAPRPPTTARPSSPPGDSTRRSSPTSRTSTSRSGCGLPGGPARSPSRRAELTDTPRRSGRDRPQERADGLRTRVPAPEMGGRQPPLRLPGVVVRDAICAGQLALDRNPAGCAGAWRLPGGGGGPAALSESGFWRDRSATGLVAAMTRRRHAARRSRPVAARGRPVTVSTSPGPARRRAHGGGAPSPGSHRSVDLAGPSWAGGPGGLDSAVPGTRVGRGDLRRDHGHTSSTTRRSPCRAARFGTGRRRGGSRASGHPPPPFAARAPSWR